MNSTVIKPTAEADDFLACVKACDLSGDAPCEACQ